MFYEIIQKVKIVLLVLFSILSILTRCATTGNFEDNLGDTSVDNYRVPVDTSNLDIHDFYGHPDQSFGFDRDATSDSQYVSIGEDTTTYVNVKIGPNGGFSNYWAKSSNTLMITLYADNDEADSVGLEIGKNKIQLISNNILSTHETCSLQVIGMDIGDTPLDVANLFIEVYELRYIDIGWYRIYDSRYPSSVPKYNITLAGVQKVLNEIYKQGVVYIQNVIGDTLLDIPYDINGNGRVDIYCCTIGGTVANDETKVIADSSATWPPTTENIAYIEATRTNWRLTQAASVGDIVLHLEEILGFECNRPNIYMIGPPTAGDSTESVTIKGYNISSLTCTLTTSLTKNHSMSHTLYSDRFVGASFGANAVVAETAKDAATTIKIAAHEIGHSIFGFRDVADITNLMCYTLSVSDFLIYRPIICVYSGSPDTLPPPDNKDMQWNMMH